MNNTKPNANRTTPTIQSLRDRGIDMADRRRTDHIDCYVDGVLPYSDDAVLAARRICISWGDDYPEQWIAEAHRASRAVLRRELGGR